MQSIDLESSSHDLKLGDLEKLNTIARRHNLPSLSDS